MNNEREKLKSYILKVKENDFVENEDEKIYEYVQLMLKYVGDVDSHLRDELIYEAFYYWIKEYKYFDADQLQEMLLKLIDDEHLFYNIGDSNTDSVFTRSFSLLVISLIISCQKESAFLDVNTFISLKNALIRYYQSERDYRGLVESKGWAHSVAHGADALNELVQCQDSDEFIHKEILEAIKHVLFNGTFNFCYKEDDRIANVVYSIYKKKRISNELLIEWFNNLCQMCDFKNGIDSYISSINFRNLTRSFYFKLEHYNADAKLLKTVLNVEKSLNSTNSTFTSEL